MSVSQGPGPGRLGRWLRRLLAVLVLAGLGIGGSVAWREYQVLTTRLAALEQEQATATRLASHEREALAGRLAVAERSLAALGDAAQVETRRRLAREEVAHYLRLAEQHLLLTRDTAGAAALLEVADRYAAELGDSALTPVRSAIARDRLALAAAGQVDVAGNYSRLVAVAERIAALPMPVFAGGRDRQGTVPAAPTPAAAGAASAWDKGLAKFRELVTVRRYDEPIRPLLDDQQRLLIRQQLLALLGEAEMALLRADGAVYRQALQRAATLFDRYYQQTAVTAFQAIRQELAAMAGVTVAPAVPDLQGSLAAMRAVLDRRGGA